MHWNRITRIGGRGWCMNTDTANIQRPYVTHIIVDYSLYPVLSVLPIIDIRGHMNNQRATCPKPVSPFFTKASLTKEMTRSHHPYLRNKLPRRHTEGTCNRGQHGQRGVDVRSGKRSSGHSQLKDSDGESRRAAADLPRDRSCVQLPWPSDQRLVGWEHGEAKFGFPTMREAFCLPAVLRSPPSLPVAPRRLPQASQPARACRELLPHTGTLSMHHHKESTGEAGRQGMVASQDRRQEARVSKKGGLAGVSDRWISRDQTQSINSRQIWGKQSA